MSEIQLDQSPRHLVFLIAGLAMFGPFSVDAMFPGFPAIAKEFDASPVTLQQLLSTYLGGFALMSLFYGPLSDAFGRRRVVLGSTLVFVLASVGAALSPSLPAFLVWRLIQGCSAGGSVVVGRAIIRDMVAGPVAQRMIAQVMMVYTVAPAIAPITSAYFLRFGGWRSIFWALAVYAGLLLLLAKLSLVESLSVENRHQLNIRSLFSTYRRISVDRQFVRLAMSAALNLGTLLLYILSAPRIVLDFLHLSTNEFYWLSVPEVIGVITGSWVAAKISGRFAETTVLQVGFGIMLGACVLNVIVSALVRQPSLPWIVLPLGLQAFGMALNQPLLTLLALDRFPTHRGAASSVQAFFSLSVTTVSGLLSPLVSKSPFSLATVALAINLVGFFLWLLSVKKTEGVAHEVIASE